MKLRIEYVPSESLTEAPHNPRVIRKRGLYALAQLMDQHGFIAPLLARREDGMLLSGHQRLRANALRARPDARVPCMFISGIGDEQAIALSIAMNNHVAQGHFDEERLALLLAQLAETQRDASAATGFSAEDLAEFNAAVEAIEPVCDLPAQDTPDDPDAAAPRDEADVVLVFEVEGEKFDMVKPHFDELIARYALTCHVRINAAREDAK